MAERPDLWQLESDLHAQGYGTLCGVDEAGAGPLAGRVYAAAVILPQGWDHPYLNDSKRVTPRRRDLLYEAITQEALAWSVAWAEPEEIDAINILQARMLAMERAIQGLSIPPDLALIDGNRSQGITTPNQTVVKGDSKSASIAAASILAKTYRDDEMVRLAQEYPDYDWQHNMGYPTRKHREAIRQHGVTPYHRRTFNLLGSEELTIPFDS